MEYDWLMSHAQAAFMEDPLTIEKAFRQIANRDQITPELWNDDYLLAFADTANLRLVTFGHALAHRSPNSLLLS